MPSAEEPGSSTPELCEEVRRPRRAALALALSAALLTLLHAGTPQAAPPTVPSEASERASELFRDASRLVASGHAEEACPMFKESDQLGPSNATRLELAKCYESTRRPATAWALYREIAAAEKLHGNKKREAEASARAAALESKLPRLTISVSNEVTALPGLAVQLDGAAVSGLGTSVPVDLGEHTVSASAPGKRAWERKVNVPALGETVEVPLKELEDQESEFSSQGPEDADRYRLLPPPVRVGPDPVQQKLMWVTGGIALVGVGLGSTFGGLAISKWDDVEAAAKTGCRDPAGHTGCSRAVRELQVRASSFATVSTFCFIAGTTAIAGTALLWLTLPATDSSRRTLGLQVTPMVGVGAAGASIAGRF